MSLHDDEDARCAYQLAREMSNYYIFFMSCDSGPLWSCAKEVS